MRRSLRIAIVATVGVVAAAILYITVFAPNKEGNPTVINSKTGDYSGIEAEIKRDSICEVLVDLGHVCYSDTVVKNIRLINSTDTPIALLDYETTCRCTWLTLPDKAIAPNDHANIELTFDSRGEFGSVGNYLCITTSDDRCKIHVWMSAEIE